MDTDTAMDLDTEIILIGPDHVAIYAVLNGLTDGRVSHLCHFLCLFSPFFLADVPQCGAADAEIKVPSGENTELKQSSFEA